MNKTSTTALMAVSAALMAVSAALGAAAGSAGTLACFRDRINPATRYGQNGLKPEVYVMNPETDYLSRAENLVDGMQVIEEPASSRSANGAATSMKQALRRQQMFFVDGITAGLTGSVDYQAVWPDGYRESRNSYRSEPFIVREERFRDPLPEVLRKHVCVQGLCNDHAGPAAGHDH